jgi:hypothetical protein
MNNLLSNNPEPEPSSPLVQTTVQTTETTQPATSNQNNDATSLVVTNQTAVSTEPSTDTLSVVNASPTATAATSSYNAITDALLGSIGDPGVSSNFKMMLFGYPGRTKTSFLGTAPNNLVYDFEDGLIAMRTAHHLSGRPLAEGVKSLPFKSLEQADELIERLQDDHEAFRQWTVFSVDTISTMHKRMLEFVMRREKAKRPSMNEYDPQTEHYTEVNTVLERFVQGLCDIKTKDIIILAHAQTVEPKNKPAKTYADFSEKLYNKLAAKMDVVAYIEMGEFEIEGQGKVTKPYIQVQSEGTIQCKSRIPLPATILDPTWPQLKAEFEKAKLEGTLTN